MRRNSIQEIIQYLKKFPFQTENKIMQHVYGYHRSTSIESNKKYADMLRRGLRAGKIGRIEAKINGTSCRYFYFVPKS